MAREPVPEEVQRFILRSIASIPHLEALLLLKSAPERMWNTPDAAHRLYLTPAAAQVVLEDLRAAGFLEEPEPARYRYAPATDELGRLIEALAGQYMHNLIAVTEVIHSRTAKAAQAFADAFKFRKDS